MHITLKHEASCAECGAMLPAGTKARWFRNGDVYGNMCHRWQVRGLSMGQQEALAAAARAVIAACRGPRPVPERTASRLAGLKEACGRQVSRKTYKWLMAELRAVMQELEMK